MIDRVQRHGNRRFLNYWSNNSEAAVPRLLKKVILKILPNSHENICAAVFFKNTFFSEQFQTDAFRNWNMLRQNIFPTTLILSCFKITKISMLKIYFTLPTLTYKETAKVIDFSKGLIFFLFSKIRLHRMRILNHPINNCFTN